MISDSETAKYIRELMLEIDRQLEDSMRMVERTCSREEYAAYKKAIGKVVNRIVFDVIEPLYEKHPTLKPPGWDE